MADRGRDIEEGIQLRVEGSRLGEHRLARKEPVKAGKQSRDWVISNLRLRCSLEEGRP